MARSLFLRPLAIVYLIAFISLLLQVNVWAGIALAIALLAGILPLSAAIGLYVLYLSLDTAGQVIPGTARRA